MQLLTKETTRKEKYPSDQIKPYSSALKSDETQQKDPSDGASVTSKTVIEIPQTKPLQFELRTYPQAWIALFLLVLLRTAVSVFQFTFSVVPGITSEYFNVSLSAVNWLANIQCIIYVIMSFFTGFIFEKLGVKRSIMASGFLCALGCTIRSISAKTNPPSYALAMVGQIIGGASAPMALNVMTMFTSTWFTENLRATAGMFVASNYGAILVMFVIPAITLDATYIPMVLNLVSGFALIVFLPLLFMPEKPPSPPMRIQEMDRPSFFDGLRLLFKNLNFWILFLIQGFNVGLSIAFCTLFAQIVGPHGYSNAEAGQLNAIAFFAGTLGCSISGPVLDYTKQHKLFLKLIAPMVVISDIAFIFMVRKDSYASVLFVLTMNQFFLSFLVPVVIELGAETSYPVAEATTNSILWQGAQLFGFIFVLVMDATRSTDTSVPANHMTNALIFQAIIAGVMAILAFLFHGKMARSEAAAWEQQTLEKLNALSDKDVKMNSHLTTSLYPLSSVLGVTLSDPPTIAGDNEHGIVLKKEKNRRNSLPQTTA
ncbi:hypothetical protein INT47_001591 [Mucor saturninus]|uniref:Major facilitator superfamily (MFS) profile domain-containing protein n=1 Tax=Mucor saturninus TaxID=64648 RepID=A0A8H7QI74_9FUNG|nr:hypothetical protein INT47_001591 [Mucor saturninus]